MAAGVVSLSGTPTQNQTLAANVTDVDGIPAGAPITYQWQQSTNNGVTWTDIAGAATGSLSLQQAYVGRLVRAVVSYTDAAGNAEQDFSPATATVGNVNDVGIATIAGTPVQGQTLTAGVTDLDGLANVAITYRWQQLINGTWSNIANATGVTYTLQAAQVGRQVRVRATYTDQLGGAESNRTSSATPSIMAINPAGNNVGIVSLSGAPTQNQVLAANVTDVDGLPSGAPIGYQWQQSSDGGVTWSDIAGATAKALTLGQAQVTKLVRAVVTYIDAEGSAESVASTATTAVANVNDAGVVAITGTSVQGQTLKADVTDLDGLANVAITYRWQQLINGTWSNIANATGVTYTLQAAQVGRQVRVLATYTDQLGGAESNRTSSATPSIVAANNHPGVLSISGTPAQSQTLTATVSDADGVPASVTYQWQQSSNGTAWNNINGATARTLALGQAQVGSFVRATATYTDVLGSSENPVSSATPSQVANVNDMGAVTVSGAATQNQILTASVADLDGVPATISYVWQSSPDGNNWTNLAATAPSLTLDSSLVGKRVRVNAVYTDLLGTSESVTSAATLPVAAANSGPTSLFTTQTPAQPNSTDGPGVDWEYGMRFTSNNPGLIQAIRYYKSPSETGTHVGHIWSSTGQPLATITFTNEGASGWQQQALATPLTINAGTAYVVSVNTNGYYAVTSQGFASIITNGGLSAPVGAGVYNDNAGVFPALVYNNENYFRDVVLVPGTSNPNNHPGVLSISGTPAQSQTLTATVSDADGMPASITYQWQQSSNGTAWNNINGATASTLALGQAQVGSFVRATATYTDVLGSSENPVSSATPSQVANVNDTGAVTVSGAATQNQILTASVADLDGVPATISYVWQSSPDGNNWTNLAATAPSLTLDSSLVGKRVRVNAVYTDLLGTSENVTSAATPSIVAANHPGVLSISGTPAQSQTLTATVSDADGVPASVTYQWQQSSNGTAWNNINGATARTLALGQAQVDSFVRATATYTDVLGSSENPVSSATPSQVANVNDMGAVTVSGAATQNQILTASVADLDGVPAAISYVWQSSPDGNTWTNLAATAPSLTLDSSLVGKRVRVNAAYTDLLGTSESVTSAATLPVAAANSGPTSLFTTQTPAQPNSTDGPGVDWEYGMRFTSNNPGLIQAIRYYKSPSETGTHVGHIWSSTGQPLATITFTNEGASGWQQQALATPLTINAGTAYVVSVNTNGYYAVTSQGFASIITNGGLSAPVGAGVYNDNAGVFPALVYNNENYFRDVVFTPASVISLLDNATVYVSETAGTATITVARTGDIQSRTTVEYTTNEIGSAGAAQAGLDYIQPTFNGRLNTGEVVFEPGETTKSFTVAIANDQLVEGNETFAVGIQNPGSGALGVPRTVLVTIVDDDSPAAISMADVAVSVAESQPTAMLTLLRSGSIDQAATIDFATSNGSALAGSDYTASSGTVTFAAGQVTKTISVPIINDTIPETDESFTVTLSNPTGAALGAQSTTTVSILDNDNLNLGNLVRQTAVTGLSEPTAIDWTPDGRYMVVAQKGGIVRVVDNGTLRATPLIDISNEVNTAGDRGVLGIAINPNFATNPYVYLLYTYDPPETAGKTGAAAPDQDGNRPSRLVRVTVNPTTMIADPASEVVLVGKNSTWAYTSRPDVNSNGDRSIVPSGIVNGTTITAPANQIEIGTQDNDPDRVGVQNQNIRDYLATDGDSHSIGAVHFGPDGYLYLSVGDGTSYNFADPRSVRVQDIHNLSGKVLRIDPVTGEGAPGNPYYQASDPNSNQSKVFYSGVRNAYRFSFDPVTNLPVLGDVGWNTWEELNTGPAGTNFGWPYLEGPGHTGSYQDLAQAMTFYNNGNRNNATDQPAVFPILSRSHGSPDNAAAITAGDFYNQNTMIFDDVLNGNIYAATLNASRQVTNVQVIDSGIPGIVDLQMGPDGLLYGADVYDGTIRRWVDSSATSASALTSGTLAVSDGTPTANIALLGQYAAASFVTSADAFGGTLIHDPPPATAAQMLTQPQHV